MITQISLVPIWRHLLFLNNQLKFCIPKDIIMDDKTLFPSITIMAHEEGRARITWLRTVLLKI